MGELMYFARDIYPENGYLETSLLSVPSEGKQRLVENDEKATEVSADTLNGVTKKGSLLTVVGIIGVLVLMAYLSK